MSEVVFTDSNFKEEALGSEMPALVDFWASWCGPCRMMAPVVEELAKEYEGKMKVGKLNVDENPEISGQYNVMSIPTLIIFKAGNPIEQIIGLKSKEDIKKKIDEILNPKS